MGADILRVHAVVTAAEQVKDVEVRGWDPSQKAAVTGSARAATRSAEIGVKPSDLADTFGGRSMVATSVPYATQAQVDGAAEAIAR